MTVQGPYPELRSGWRSLVSALGPWAAAFLALLMAALPLAPGLVPLALIACTVGIAARYAGAFAPFQRSNWLSPFPWLALYYLLHVVAMAWTEDIAFGLFDLQIKAPLLVIPVLALLMPRLSRSARDTALAFGVAANVLAVLICLFAALGRIALGSEFEVSQELFSARFSFLVHPSYFALYLCFAIATWMFTPIHSWVRASWSLTALLVMALGVVLSGSKMGWILLVLLLPAGVVLRWNVRWLRRSLLGTMLVSMLGLVVLVAVSPYARDRVNEAWHAAFAQEVDRNSETSSAVRRITWSAAQELVSRHPLQGTGTGDIKNELLDIYGERGQLWAQEHRLNAHSQFLQSAACLGFAGALLLVLALVLPFFGPWRKDALAVVFLLACALNWSVESMLEVQAGAAWTAVLMLLLFRSHEGPLRLSDR